MELAANRGLDALSEEQFHIVHSAEKIYQFTAGSLRALCFLAESGRVVICTHAFVKKRNKTPPAEVDKAIALKKRYLNEEVMWIEAESD